MSKNKIHIDDVFKRLKNFEHQADMEMFDEIQAMRTDAEWGEKFEDYAQQDSDIPPFENLPFAISDKSPQPGKAWWIYTIIAGVVATFLMGSSIVDFNFNNDAISLNTAETAISELPTQPEKYPNEQKLSQLDLVDQEQKETFNKLSNPSKGKRDNNEQKTKKPNVKTSINIKDKTLDSQTNSFEENQFKSKKGTNYFTSSPTEQMLEEQNSSSNNSSPFPISQKEKSEINSSVIDEKLNDFRFAPFTPSSNKRSILSNPPSLEFSDNYTKELKLKNDVIPSKSKPSFFIEGGINTLTADVSLPNTTPNSPLGFHVRGGVSYKRLTLNSGLEYNTFSYRTNKITLQIYDSIPHIGINNDTIGWFKRNLRDTTVMRNLNSEVSISTIPLTVSFKPMSLGKWNLQVGLGLNFNFIETKSIWADNPNNGYTENLLANNPNLKTSFNLGASLNTRLAYQITPLKELYLSLHFKENENALQTTSQINISLSGVQLDFGVKYYITNLR